MKVVLLSRRRLRMGAKSERFSGTLCVFFFFFLFVTFLVWVCMGFYRCVWGSLEENENKKKRLLKEKACMGYM